MGGLLRAVFALRALKRGRLVQEQTRSALFRALRKALYTR